MATLAYSAPNSGAVVEVELERIHPSPGNPRKRFDPAALQELADSIREHGVLQPIVLRPNADGYEIVAGERRWRASQLAGLATIPATVRDLSEEQALRIALVENLQRQDLDPLEEAEGYRQLARLGMKQREIAESVHRSQPAVANAMRLLELPESVRAKISAGELTASHGIALASYAVNSHVQEKLAELAVAGSWTTKKVESYFADRYYPGDGLEEFVYELRGGIEFDWEAECRGVCPHNAYRANSREWLGTCLRPACFEAKRKAAQLAARDAAAAAVRAIETRAQTDVPTLDELRGTQYRRLDDELAGCRRDCAHRRKAIGWDNQPVDICLDVSCQEKLRSAADRAARKAQLARYHRLQSLLAERVDALTELGPRELALIALRIVGACPTAAVRPAFARITGRPESEIPDLSHYGSREDWYRELAKLGALELGKLALEALLRDEMYACYDRNYGGGTKKTDWYLGESPEEEDVVATKRTCPLAGLPCEPATCVQRCSKTEATNG